MIADNISLFEDNEYQAPLGWLSPSGRFFPCPDNGHRAYAHALFEKFGGQVPKSTQDQDFYSEEQLLHGNWMKLTAADTYPYYCKFTTMYDNPTREQFDALTQWSQNQGLNPPWEFKKSRHAHYQYEYNDYDDKDWERE